MGQALTNTTLKPSEVTEDPWLFCDDETIREQYSNVTSWGKWMMFIRKEELDEKWATACEVYNQGKLTGIASMKVSTAYPNPRASDPTTGVINFYCGPAENEASMLEYGKKLLEELPYDANYMYYKSDEQTAGGTRATGQRRNSLYKIPVPRNVNRGGSIPQNSGVGGSNPGIDSGKCAQAGLKQGPSKSGEGQDDPNNEVYMKQKTSSLKPSDVTEDPWLFCDDETIRGQYSYVTSWGKWMMFVRKEELDEKWATACELYNQGKLTGIASMKVSTAYPNPRASDPNTGVINFYCGPAEDEEAIMQYGELLLEEIPYDADFIYYKSDEQTAGGTRATGQRRNSLYRIAVPRNVNRGGSLQQNSDVRGGNSESDGGKDAKTERKRGPSESGEEEEKEDGKKQKTSCND